MKDKYISYREIAAAAGVRPGDKLCLSSDILAIAFIAGENGEKFSADELLNSFQRQLTPRGTLLIPAFNFSFSDRGMYDYRKTPSLAGALGNAALKRNDFRRTAHPMHSFCVWGKDKELLCAMQNRDSFGKDSPFAYMHRENVIQIMLGTDYQRSMTFVHYVENMAHVPYRFYKQFTGIYVDGNGSETVRTYDYPARYLELGSEEQFNRIGKKLEEAGIAEYFQINGIPVRKVSLSESYPVIYEDAVNNMCRNLYDFECDRDLIWRSYGNKRDL